MAGIIGAENRFGRDFNNPDADMQGNITALYDIGCVVGSIVCYFVGERLGRRTMLISGGLIMIVGAAILASSYTVAQLIVGRIVTGIGNGMNSSTAPVYQGECSPARIRGALLTLQGTVTILGVVIAYWADYGTSFYDSSFQVNMSCFNFLPNDVKSKALSLTKCNNKIVALPARLPGRICCSARAADYRITRDTALARRARSPRGSAPRRRRH